MRRRAYLYGINFSIAVFSLALIWFAFKYYPNALKSYHVDVNNKVLASEVTSQSPFPIKTARFTISFNSQNQSYDVLLLGKTVDEILENKHGADLALKTALSLENLCGVRVVYNSNSGIAIPKKYQSDSLCQQSRRLSR